MYCRFHQKVVFNLRKAGYQACSCVLKEGKGGWCRGKLLEALKCGVDSEPLGTEGATNLAQLVVLSFPFHSSQLCTLV